MQRGDVVSVDLGAAQSRAQAGVRPAIIWQAPTPANFPTVVVLPLTSNLNALRFAGTLRVEPDSSNGLSMPSVVMCFQITAQDRRNIIRKIGCLSQTDIEAVASVLRPFLLL